MRLYGGVGLTYQGSYHERKQIALQAAINCNSSSPGGGTSPQPPTSCWGFVCLELAQVLHNCHIHCEVYIGTCLVLPEKCCFVEVTHHLCILFCINP